MVFLVVLYILILIYLLQAVEMQLQEYGIYEQKFKLVVLVVINTQYNQFCASPMNHRL